MTYGRGPSVRKIGDGLIEAAFYCEGVSTGERAERIAAGVFALGSVALSEVWATPPWHRIEALSYLANEPLLSRVAAGRKVDLAIADHVCDNFKHLADSVLGFLNHSDFENTNTLGATTEAALTGLLWWGISHGFYPVGTYVRPSTRQQDDSDPGVIHNGFDATICMTHGKKTKLQFKSAASEIEYGDDIRVISPDMLKSHDGLSRITSERILRCISNGDTTELAHISDQLRLIIKGEPAPTNETATGFNPSMYRHSVAEELSHD